MLPDFKKAKVLVIGDLMLDRYWHGETQRISPEAPVPVVQVMSLEDRPGGAANVALNIARLGGQVTLCGGVGEDDAHRTLKTLLEQQGVECAFVVHEGHTTTKLRVVAKHQQLMRLDFEAIIPPPSGTIETLQPLMEAHDVIIFSDYAKGFLSEVAEWIALARKLQKMVLVDPKNTDFISYKNANILTPNFKEFQAAVGPVTTEEEIIAKARETLVQYALDTLVITRGEKGMLVVSRDSMTHISATAREVFDITGAGDTVIATLGLMCAAGISIEESARVANAAAGIVVGKLGTAFVSENELKEALVNQTSPTKILEPERLREIIRTAKARGERIIFTNGCFDLLHLGHIRYLEAAKALGTRLIIAVNDDASIQRLKGPTRPVYPLEFRQEMLASLASVDWVTHFSEDTPLSLIEFLDPDVLVKGGDYKREEIVGYNHMIRRGGEVRVIPFVEGYSSTKTIERVQSLANASLNTTEVVSAV